MYMREMPNSCFSRLLERIYVRGGHNSGIPSGKKSRSYKLGMKLLTAAHDISLQTQVDTDQVQCHGF